MESERYSRQILYAPIGREGQEKLGAAQVLIAGCGALGSSHAELLARAGVGRLRIVDRDFVETSNLQRQTLFSEADAAEHVPKAIAAARRISQINSDVFVDPIVADINASDVESLLSGCDIVLDGSDNFQLRYLLNDACVKMSMPWIYGAAVSGYGATMTIRPFETPCLRCIFDEMPDAGSSPTCDTAGVIMPIISTISAIQVTEAIKILVGDAAALHGTLMQIDLWSNERHSIKLAARNAECKTCGLLEFEYLDAETRDFAAVLCGRDAVQISPPRSTVIDLDAFAAKLNEFGVVTLNEYLVRFAAGAHEITVFRDGRAIIKGTDDVSRGRSLYARYIGS